MAEEVRPQVGEGGSIYRTPTGFRSSSEVVRSTDTTRPVEPVSIYSPDAPRIIATAQSDALSPGSIVEATWEYNNTSLDAFTTRLTLTEGGAEQWLSFHIARGAEVPWPVGTYEVTISVDGTTMQQAAVEVSGQS